jgi:TM2 domain-containing membrane protein YozV
MKQIITKIKNRKSKWIAAILAYFLGTFGIHKFYLGKKSGWLYLIFCWTGIPSIIGVVEAIIYCVTSQEKFDMQYNNEYYILDTVSNASDVMILNSRRYDFTQQYYNNLKDVHYDVESLQQKLSRTADVMEVFFNNPVQVTEALRYDMVTIYSLIYGQQYDQYNIEAFAMFLVLPGSNSGIINDTYTNLAQANQTRKYKDVIDETIRMYVATDNPLMMYQQNQNALAFPAFLKQKNNPLFKQYADVMYKYARILTQANAIANAAENKALSEVSQMLYNPI